MSLFVDPIEGFWVVVNVIALVVTFSSWVDARQNRAAFKLLSGMATSREITTSADVRREVLRMVMAGLLLSIAIPGLFTDRPVNFSLPLVALILVPVALATTCLLDARDRRRLTLITAAELVIERDTSITRLERKIDENTRISQKASDHAEEAYHEANTLNAKIADQGAQIVAQGERQDRRDATADNLQTVADDTAEKVSDIHDATVHGEAGA